MKRTLILACFIPALLYAQAPPDTAYLRNYNYALQTSLYDIYQTDSAKVVMLGNSITFGVNWNELMGRQGVVNRGIGGDLTSGFLHRLDYVYRLHPVLCCVMGGINDIYNDISPDTIFANYKHILQGLRSHHITPVIQSTLYVSPKWKRAALKNQDVTRLNMLLREYAVHEGILFLDLNDVLSENGYLRETYSTPEGVHLNAAGYRLWRDQLEPVFRSFGL
jgi:lysophospholipase L1-like esterase